MIVLSIEAAIVANFLGSTNIGALKARVAILFLKEIPYDFGFNGMKFIYLSEIWPKSLRAKVMLLGVAMISRMNIVWLQSASSALAFVCSFPYTSRPTSR